jgi:hypothetical protein
MPRPTREDQKAARAHRRKKRRGNGPSFAALRLANLFRLFEHRYGGPLPDDDAGRGDLEIVLHHVATARDAEHRMRSIARTWAPWADRIELAAIISKIIARPKRFKADTVAEKLGVTNAERRALALWTLGAIDRNKEQREADQRERRRAAQELRRRAAGGMSRADYRASVRATSTLRV